MHFITAIRKLTSILDKSSYANFIPYFFVVYLTSLGAEVWAFIPQTNNNKEKF